MQRPDSQETREERLVGLVDRLLPSGWRDRETLAIPRRPSQQILDVVLSFVREEIDLAESEEQTIRQLVIRWKFPDNIPTYQLRHLLRVALVAAADRSEVAALRYELMKSERLSSIVKDIVDVGARDVSPYQVAMRKLLHGQGPSVDSQCQVCGTERGVNECYAYWSTPRSCACDALPACTVKAAAAKCYPSEYDGGRQCICECEDPRGGNRILDPREPYPFPIVRTDARQPRRRPPHQPPPPPTALPPPQIIPIPNPAPAAGPTTPGPSGPTIPDAVARFISENQEAVAVAAVATLVVATVLTAVVAFGGGGLILAAARVLAFLW